MSMRASAAPLGVDPKTISNDLKGAGVENSTPQLITGLTASSTPRDHRGHRGNRPACTAGRLSRSASRLNFWSALGCRLRVVRRSANWASD